MKLERILAATDLSSRAGLAMERAIQLAAQHGARLSLLHVLDTTLPEAELLETLELSRDSLLQTLTDETRQRLEEDFIPFAQAAGVAAQAHVIPGRDVPEILALARRGNADLLVLGAHGAHFLRDRLVSTTTEKVVRHGDCPTLVVKHPTQGPYRRVLVPVDFSACSRQAAQLAGLLTPQAEITLLHVLDSQVVESLRSAGLDDRTLDRYYTEQEQHALREMDQLRATLEYTPAEVRLAPGYPPDVIQASGRQLEADLVVMGTEGRGRLQRMLLGSVATHALHESRCDILLVRERSGSRE